MDGELIEKKNILKALFEGSLFIVQVFHASLIFPHFFLTKGDVRNWGVFLPTALLLFNG